MIAEQTNLRYRSFREDGWPLCPNCGDDELWCPGSVQFYAENGRSPSVAECIAMGLSCYRCQQQIPGNTRRFWRVPEHDVWKGWAGHVVLFGLAYYDVQETRLLVWSARRHPGLSPIDELKAILQIEDDDERQTAALIWWDDLTDEERAEVRVFLQAVVEVVRDVFRSLGQVFGQFAEHIAEFLAESPELQAYLQAVSGEVSWEEGEDAWVEDTRFTPGEPDAEAEEVYRSFWRSIVETNGRMDEHKVKRELWDFYYVMHQVSIVYDSLTGGLFSKPNHKAETIISAVEDRESKYLAQETKVLEDRVGALTYALVQIEQLSSAPQIKEIVQTAVYGEVDDHT